MQKSIASKLNQTFVPRQLLKKTQISNTNAILTNQFQKTSGNAYIQFDPLEVKFNGYQLNKPQSAIIKIINKSPIPQRVHVLPPTEPGFSIKVYKKGPIAAGMSENIQVTFLSDVYKYQYDVVKINTETGNFVVPVYAYPSIPKITEIFPKIVDFGNVCVNQSNSYMYPISNPVPLDFGYQFRYIQQSPAFIITPIKGVIGASSTQNIEITFVPSDKKTFVAQATFHINQFDFQPIKIKIFGTGVEKKDGFASTKRIKSSKLNPLAKQDSKKSQINQTENIKALDLNLNSQKRSFLRSRTSYPKLVKKPTGSLANNTIVMNQDKLESTFKKQGERQYNSQFSKIQQLDKQKQIKFMQYLGDRAMNQQQLDFQYKLIQETKKARLEGFKQYCFNRHDPELKGDAQVDLTKVAPQTVTWDTKKNDELKLRKQKLNLFVKAGSKIIKRYRLIKRLGKIKKFLQDCTSKQDVRKKVEQDFAKSRDLSKQGGVKILKKLDFSQDMLQINSFPLHYGDQNQSAHKIFQTQGSTKFDDDKPLQQIQPHQAQILSYNPTSFPSDFFPHTRKHPSNRTSAEQQYPLKTPSLPTYEPAPPSTVYQLPLKVPTHQFIYNNFQIGRYKMLSAVDERDPEYLLDATCENVEDQFQGWSRGDMDVLKAKFSRNMGTEFVGVSGFNYPEMEFGFFGHMIDKNLPKQIGNMQIQRDDIIEEGDSDDQKIANIQPQKSDTIVTKIEQASTKAKQRRQKGHYTSYERNLLQTVDRNLQKIKFKHLSQAVDKISQFNKWADKTQSKIFI